MRVYHFLSSEYSFDDIRRKRLKISRLSDLNDPFELMSVDMPTRDHRKIFNSFKRDMNEKYGVLCFSKDWKNPVLWSHYSDKHKGICFGFDVLDDLLMNIEYRGTKLLEEIEASLTPEKLTPDLMQKILKTKFEDWEYENEVRIFVQLEEADRETGHYFKVFDSTLALKDVIVGARSNVKKKDIEEALDCQKSGVRIIKARMAFGSFRVVENKAGFSHVKKNA